MKKLLVLITLSIFSIMGCKTVESHFYPATDDFTKATTRNLCSYYGLSKDQKTRNELIRRNAFSSQVWELIDSQKIAIGMPEDAVLASIGIPKENTFTKDKKGKSIQNSYVYLYDPVKAPYQPKMEVVFVNHTVKSIGAYTTFQEKYAS